MSQLPPIKPRERDTIVQALAAGVVPRVGLQHIQVGRALEVVHAPRLLAFLERRRDRHLAVGLDARRPEDVVEAHRGEGHRLEGIVTRGPLSKNVKKSELP